MKVRLLIQMRGAEYPWEHDGNAFKMGRSLDCELPLTGADCSGVSGTHARMEFSGVGLIIWDLSSKNGTFVNGRRIYAPQPLHVGDEIHLGVAGPRVKILNIEHPAANKQAIQPAPLPARFETNRPPPAQPSMPTPPMAHLPTPVAMDPAVSTVPQSPSFAPVPAAPLDRGPTPTRMLLIGAMARQKKLWILIVGLLFLLGIAVCVTLFFVFTHRRNDTVNPKNVANANKGPTRKEICDKATRSACWIRLEKKIPGKGRVIMHGSGSVIDTKKRLIITNYHVATAAQMFGVSDFDIYFPQYRADGTIIREKEHYLSKQLFIKGKTIARSKTLDLAVIELSEPLLKSSLALKLAESSPKDLSNVHLIGGNPRGSGNALWTAGSGHVRSVVADTIPYRDDDGNLLMEVKAKIIRSTIPSNPGDSGAAVVNDQGLLVGVNTGDGGGEGNRLHIDVTDVTRFLRMEGFID